MRLVVVLAGLVLAGCSETEILQYQGRPAESALECQAAYEEARSRRAGVDYSSQGSLIGSAIGSGLVKGITESAYKSCLARVAALPGGGTTAVASPVPQASPIVRTQCNKRGGVMQGGSGYC